MPPNKYVAFKCTYNDADEGILVGFNGTCSDSIIKANIKNDRIWCKQQTNPCKKYYDNGFRGKRPNYPCSESELFYKWKFGSGYTHPNDGNGKPIKAKIDDGGIAILTTRFPNEKESDRKIIGLFKISRVKKVNNEETIVYADEKLRIRLPIEEAKELYFWEYYSNNNGDPFWGSRLHRFLKAGQVKNILSDLLETLQNESDKEIIVELLKDFTQVKNAEHGQLNMKIPRLNRVLLKRKYGKGGEGQNHLKLKEWISQNPEYIGLINIIRPPIVEHYFDSSDTVDILFIGNDDVNTVVEIETDNPYPGCHQLIKYRALRCAQRGIPLDSNEVNAVLVAWKVSDREKDFCKKYNIKWFEKKLDQ